ncbi:beta-1,3-galactosyl-O-glycosyl-glycoprotein beta-1,6-N-acetylglucosaminyltransferase 4 [Hippocampus zosterae]|uniref:beta-1,3-galactosyl-O-glycosyl-glycoprotein beta-1,6-N-acetylglucosaminyltransferase 4 n=1 Tax=Hippocampus zosterae TaxID=109293 RepID=UPI00223D81F8|nr:beta-1,3-galactosyl-O-glycosyl-glycoprotein beta-1,6-N-acetylglucosaminyltransferase 4 [Hippocampus zosterae]
METFFLLVHLPMCCKTNRPRSRMKIKCGCSIHRLRHMCFLFLVSLLATCFLKLVYLKVTVGESIYIDSHGVTGRLPGIHSHTYDVNCTAIYELDPVEIGKALEIKQKVLVPVDDESTVSLTSDCPAFMKTRHYNGVLISELEHNFPLAYSLVVHKNAPMVERILHAIYAPQNIYCIHYDQKSSPAFIKAMENLARCVPSVFIASKLESVKYAHVSRLNADLNCLSDLLRSEVKWKYVINLCGQDFPLKSNNELVRELRQLNGSNMLESSRPSELKKQRFNFHHELKTVPHEYHSIPVKTAIAKDVPPHGIMVFIGSAYFVLSRQFVNYISSSKVAMDFLAWSADTYSPDEHFWATLVRMPGVPGHIARSEPDITDLKSKTRLVKWSYLEGHLYPPCTGTHVRSVCIYGAAELRWLLNDGHWFANKFDPKVDPILISCLEEKLMELRHYDA